MANNPSVDPTLIVQAVRVSGERIDVARAVERYIARYQQKDLLDSMGKREWDVNFDCKAERARQ